MDMSQAPTGAGLTQLGELPRDSQMAIGGIGLAQNLQQAVSQDDAMRTSVESSLEPFGITGIRDIAKLIGTETAVAMSMSRERIRSLRRVSRVQTLPPCAPQLTWPRRAVMASSPHRRFAWPRAVGWSLRAWAPRAVAGWPVTGVRQGRPRPGPRGAGGLPVDLERLADADEEVSDLKDARPWVSLSCSLEPTPWVKRW